MPALSLQARAERIEELINRLRSNKSVQARDINTVLSQKQRRAMEYAWNEQKELRKEEKPTDLLKYEKKLREALLWYGKADQSSAVRNPRSYRQNRTRSENFESKAVSAFEDALECLQDILDRDPSLRFWLDRDIDFSPEGQLSLDPDGMPRVITSRSRENKSSPKEAFGWKSKSEIKIEALESALNDLKNSMASTSEKVAKSKADADMATLLKAKLNGLKKND